MSRARQRITAAVESRGYKVKEIAWEPIYNAGEMCGLAGGWDLVVDRPYIKNTFPGDELGGLSVEEVLADIDYWLAPSEPCDCDREHNAMFAAGLINDPQKPTHAPRTGTTRSPGPRPAANTPSAATSGQNRGRRREHAQLICHRGSGRRLAIRHWPLRPPNNCHGLDGRPQLRRHMERDAGYSSMECRSFGQAMTTPATPPPLPPILAAKARNPLQVELATILQTTKEEPTK